MSVELSFFDQRTIDCPFAAYEWLRDQAPVWRDPDTGMFVVSRYEDVRAVLLDTTRFSNDVGTRKGAVEQEVTALYRERGWEPAPSLDRLDEPRHMQLRRVFEKAFRPARVQTLASLIEQLAAGLADALLEQGSCEFVSRYAVPLPLHVIGRHTGMADDAMPKIKVWTDAWIRRLGLMLSREERLRSTELEIEAQHFFQEHFERLRREPADNLLSDLVNDVVPEWGRPLSDNELHAEMMADLFVGGSETTTNALSAGVLMLTQNPEVWRALKQDRERHLPHFIEEVLRLEAPVQCLVRQTTEDVELQGITIPAGSVVRVTTASANRDGRRYGCPESVDLERNQPRTHLAFGVGSHHCLGAPLARLELHHGFSALLERLDEIRLVGSAQELHYHPNYFLRSLTELQIEFTPAQA